MTPKLIIINFLLAILLVTTIVKTYNSGTQNELQLVSEDTKNIKSKEMAIPKPVLKNVHRESYYEKIIAGNLFSNSRSEYIPDSDAGTDMPVLENRIQGKRIVLYGIVSQNDKKTALISNPELGRDKSKYAWVKEGEKIGEVRIVSIGKGDIILEDRSQKYKILLNDSEKDKSKGDSLKNIDRDKNSRIIVTESENVESISASPAEKKKKETPEDGMEIINTPFGDMKVRKK